MEPLPTPGQLLSAWMKETNTPAEEVSAAVGSNRWLVELVAQDVINMSRDWFAPLSNLTGIELEVWEQTHYLPNADVARDAIEEIGRLYQRLQNEGDIDDLAETLRNLIDVAEAALNTVEQSSE